jgi:23S rRNA (adenine2030-N6)-methyltransferase
MNYRHAYHAGNFADVVKHVTLMLCLAHLKRKAAPFRVLDSHAGAGRYALDGAEAGATAEWRDGIGRLVGEAVPPLPAAVHAVLAPYLQLVGPAPLRSYPGSPALIAGTLRAGDSLVAVEQHPDDAKRLAALFKSDRRVRAIAGDGWTAVKAELPPPERRGLVLVDPPFERPGELHRLADAFSDGLERFRTGTYLLWYPIKDVKPVARFHRAIAECAARCKIERPLAVELFVRAPRHPDKLNGTGMIVANPPYTLESDLAGVLEVLADRFAQGPGAGAEVRTV